MKEKRARGRSRLWFIIHSWVGLKLSLLLSFVLITGTLATLSIEMDWLLRPAMRVSPQPAANRASWGAIYDAAKKTYPTWSPRLIQAPEDPWFAAIVTAQTPEGPVRFIYVDPYSATVQGDGNWVTLERFFRNTHRHLMMPVRYGVPVVSALSFLLVASLATGIAVYKGWWRGFFRLPRTRDARTFWGDLHRLGGVWSMWFIAVIAATGLFYLAESLGWDAPMPPPPKPEGTAALRLTGAKLDAMAEKAAMLFPELEIDRVILPPNGKAALRLEGNATALLVRPRANRVAFDPASGEALSVLRGEDLSLHQRISEAADPLHFGYFGGLPTKLLYFLFGVLLSGLSVSGVYLCGKRAVRGFTDGAAGTPRPCSAWKPAVASMGVWVWPCAALILLSFGLTAALIARN